MLTFSSCSARIKHTNTDFGHVPNNSRVVFVSVLRLAMVFSLDSSVEIGAADIFILKVMLTVPFADLAIMVHEPSS